MPRRNISQQEARQLQGEVEQLEAIITAEHNAFLQDVPGGVCIAQMPHPEPNAFLPGVIRNSRILGHPVICTVDDQGTVFFYAMPQPPAQRTH